MKSAKSVSQGKLIDTWHYDRARLDGIPNKILVRIYLHKKFSGDTLPLSPKEVWFEAKCDYQSIRFTVRSPNIESLRQSVWDQLDGSHEITWEKWFVVKVSEDEPSYSGKGVELRFTFEQVYRGKSLDDSDIIRHRPYGSGEVIEPWPEAQERHKREDREAIYVRSTRDVEIALVDAVKAVRKFRNTTLRSVMEIAQGVQMIPCPKPSSPPRATAVNIHHFQSFPPGCISVMRPSPYSNPYSHLPHAQAQYRTSSKAESLVKYREYLKANPELVERGRRELSGKLLGCVCKPDACHADFWVKICNGEEW